MKKLDVPRSGEVTTEMATVLITLVTAMIMLMLERTAIYILIIMKVLVMSMVMVVAIRWNDNDGWEDADDGWSPAPSNYNNQDRKVERRQVWLKTRFLGAVRSGVVIWQIDI